MTNSSWYIRVRQLSTGLFYGFCDTGSSHSDFG